MTQLAPILVPLDGSDIAASAASLARRVARRTGDRVVLLHVIEPGELGWSVEAETQAVAAAAEMLAAEVARFHTPVEVKVVVGSPAEAISRIAGEIGAGLVVLTPRGRGGLVSVVFGSVTRDLLVACRLPMLLAHPSTDGNGPVVAGVDAGPGSPNVVAYGRALADGLGVGLDVAHVMNVDIGVARHPERYSIAPERWQALCDEHRERAFAPVRAEYPKDAREVLLFGVPTEEIGRLAEAEEASVVVVGRKGESGADLGDFFSVAFGVATRGTFATLIV